MRRYKEWQVIPDDPDIAPQYFRRLQDAQDWADGLCCSYDIQEITY